MNRPQGADWARGLLKGLQTVADSLPSDDEVRRSVEAIDALSAFLAELRRHLLAQPTSSQREDVQKAIVVLDSFLAANHGRVVFGAPKQGTRKSGPQSDVEEIKRELEALPTEEVQARLVDESLYSTETLKGLARVLELRLDTRLPRADLADAIFKRGFANPRGYEALRGTPTNSPMPASAVGGPNPRNGSGR